MRCHTWLFLLLLPACRLCSAQDISPSVCSDGCITAVPARACVAAASAPPAQAEAWLLLAALAVYTAGRLATKGRR